MNRHCASCGKELTSSSPRARFCGNTCRSRAHRAGGSAPGGVSIVPPVDLASRRAASRQSDAEPAQGFVAAVEVTLSKAGRLDTWEGQAALFLAKQMDDAPLATLSARASANRELREAMATALKGVAPATSSVQEIRDELRRRRRERELERAQGAG